MFAPRGTGIIWGNDLNWARIQPTIPTFSSEDSFNGWMEGQPPAGPNTASRVSPGGFTAYEHQWAMSAAFAMHEQMGRARVAGRIRDLNTQCKQGLSRMKNVTLHTPMDPALSAGLVAFEVAGVSPGDVVKKLLARHIVASTSPYKVSYARLAPSLVNTPQEVDRALAAVREIAGA
jgi:selenocysteine lyase/cysteine desulfurase